MAVDGFSGAELANRLALGYAMASHAGDALVGLADPDLYDAYHTAVAGCVAATTLLETVTKPGVEVADMDAIVHDHAALSQAARQVVAEVLHKDDQDRKQHVDTAQPRIDSWRAEVFKRFPRLIDPPFYELTGLKLHQHEWPAVTKA